MHCPDCHIECEEVSDDIYECPECGEVYDLFNGDYDEDDFDEDNDW